MVTDAQRQPTHTPLGTMTGKGAWGRDEAHHTEYAKLLISVCRVALDDNHLWQFPFSPGWMARVMLPFYERNHAECLIDGER